MKERLSALFDGELSRPDYDTVMAAISADPALRSDWQEWHLVGDVLKREHPILSPDFMRHFCERLAAEPIVIGPIAHRRRRDLIKRAIAPVSVAASVAFVSLVSWQAYRGASQQPAVKFVQTAAVTQANSARLRTYLAAHHVDNGNVFANQDVMNVSYQAPPVR